MVKAETLRKKFGVLRIAIFEMRIEHQTETDGIVIARCKSRTYAAPGFAHSGEKYRTEIQGFYHFGEIEILVVLFPAGVGTGEYVPGSALYYDIHKDKFMKNMQKNTIFVLL